MLLKLEMDECLRRIKVNELLSDREEVAKTMSSRQYVGGRTVSHEIILYHRGRLEFNRGRGASCAMGLKFKGRYSEKEWSLDKKTFLSGTLPTRVYAPLLLDEDTARDWLLCVSEERYKRFLYTYCSKPYKKILRFYFSIITREFVETGSDGCKRLIEWTTNYWFRLKRVDFSFYDLALKKISKNYLEKLRATWNRIVNMKGVPVEFSLTPFSFDMEENYRHDTNCNYKRKEIITSTWEKKKFKATLYVKDFLLTLYHASKRQQVFDPSTIFTIMACKQYNIVHQIFRHTNDDQIMKYGHYICDPTNALTNMSYEVMISLVPMCRIKNTQENNAALRIRCLRDALFKRYQMAKDEAEYIRFLKKQFDIVPKTLDTPMEPIYNHTRDKAIEHWVKQCRGMNNRFVEDENTVYVVCVPSDKPNAFPHILRNSDFDIDWKKRKHADDDNTPTKKRKV